MEIFRPFSVQFPGFGFFRWKRLRSGASGHNDAEEEGKKQKAKEDGLSQYHDMAFASGKKDCSLEYSLSGWIKLIKARRKWEQDPFSRFSRSRFGVRDHCRIDVALLGNGRVMYLLSPIGEVLRSQNNPARAIFSFGVFPEAGASQIFGGSP